MLFLMTLTAVCAVLLPRMFWREKSDFAARWGCCREIEFLAARFCREIFDSCRIKLELL